MEFVVLLRPHRTGQAVPRQAELTRVGGGYVPSAELTHGRVLALLPVEEGAEVSFEGSSTRGQVAVRQYGTDGTIAEALAVGP